MAGNFKGTRRACYIGYVTQAITVNLAPILYLIFQNEFGISRTDIGKIALLMFALQLGVDFLSVYFLDKIGYRRVCIGAHFFAATGLVMMSVLPYVMRSPYAGLIISIVFSSVGSGLIEVMISPIMNSLPDDGEKESMALLHSFYCWGQAAVVLLSTLVLLFMGNEHWRLLPVFWAIIPIFNMIAFTRVPLGDIEDEEKTDVRRTVTSKIFIVSFVIMVCAGSSEMAMSQWASYFAEAGLGVTKVVGDILGPCMFAVFMAIGRTLYGLFGKNISMRKALTWCTATVIVSYTVAVFSPNPILALFGCSLCGLGVSLLWPGVLSYSAQCLPTGGTSMFALLALGGDIGCSAGPFICGAVSDAVSDSSAVASAAQFMGIGNFPIRAGLLAVAVFPILALVGVRLMKKSPN